MRNRRHSGFTIVEAVITLAILGVAATVALPEFVNMLATRRVANATDDLYATFFYARSEAIRQNMAVTVAPINGNWSEGWEVDNPSQPGNFLVKHAYTNLQVTEASNYPQIVFLATGRPQTGPVPTFSLCDDKKKARERVVMLDLSGLPNVKVKGACP